MILVLNLVDSFTQVTYALFFIANGDLVNLLIHKASAWISNYLSSKLWIEITYPKRQRLHRWCFGMDK